MLVFCQYNSSAGWLFPFCSGYNEDVLAPTSVQKVEPKVFFANERTFLHWLHNGVTLYTIAAGILAFAADSGSGSRRHNPSLFMLQYFSKVPKRDPNQSAAPPVIPKRAIVIL